MKFKQENEAVYWLKIIVKQVSNLAFDDFYDHFMHFFYRHFLRMRHHARKQEIQSGNLDMIREKPDVITNIRKILMKLTKKQTHLIAHNQFC